LQINIFSNAAMHNQCRLGVRALSRQVNTSVIAQRPFAVGEAKTVTLHGRLRCARPDSVVTKIDPAWVVRHAAPQPMASSRINGRFKAYFVVADGVERVKNLRGRTAIASDNVDWLS
jgi:hypothetical protein